MQKCIDWMALGAALLRDGLTTNAVAAQCGTSQPQVSRIFTGVTKSPSYPLGQALIDLFTQRFHGVDVPELPPAQQNIAQPATETVANTGD
jgi:hypothetical protein